MSSRPPSATLIDDGEDASRVLARFRDYPKLLSWLILHVAGLPALSGVVVEAWNSAAEDVVERFVSRWASRTLLLRSDSASETGRAPRGGFVVGDADVEQATRALLGERRVVFLLEPASPFDDLYSANLEPDSEWHEWLIEVVGAGFDASDLNRGDVTPHEQLRVGARDGAWELDARRIATPQAQAAARTIRIRKVAGLLNCKPADVGHVLQQRGDTMLLDSEAYVPIPEELLVRAIASAARLRPLLTRHDLRDQRVVISSSYLTREARLVFWDVVWPGAKYRVDVSPAASP